MDRYAKAIVGAILAGLAALAPTLADNTISAVEWTVIAAAVVGGLGLVWAVPNAPARSKAPPTGDAPPTV